MDTGALTPHEHEPATDALLAVRAIDKRFPGVHALKSVSFDIFPGEIHALVGENGAGKSTLMKVLSGVHAPDSGTLTIDGVQVDLSSPQDAFARGIAMVWQDTRLIPTLDVAWNIALQHEPGGVLLVDRQAMRADARKALARIGSPIDPDAPVASLSRAQMQQVEIARALSRNARVLILDEPTSALTPVETDDLFAVLRELKAAGTAIIFISHRLPEVRALADRVTVMKDGAVTGTSPIADASDDDIVTLMVGRPMGLDYPPRATSLGDEVLRVTGLQTAASRDVSFIVRAGEIVGLGGIQGSGQQETARALFGLGLQAGNLELHGTQLNVRQPADAIAAGLVYVPADRRQESLFTSHGIRENAALPHVQTWTAGGLIDSHQERDAVTAQMDRLQVKAPNTETLVNTLSGGNQQKVVFARWFIGSADVYVLDEPTQGVDVETKAEIYTLVRALADSGAAVVLVSSDLPELIGLTDRIVVFSDGEITADLSSADASEEQVMRHAVRKRDVLHSSENATTDTSKVSVGKHSPFWARYTPAALLFALVLAITVAASLLAPFFLTPRNFASMAGQIAPLAFAALGQMATIVLGGIDLSVGPTISLVTAIASYVLSAETGLPVAVGIAACLCAGLLVGCLNALLTAYLRIPDLVATLATFTIVQGAALIVRPSPGGRLDPDVASAITERVMMVPIVFALVLAAYVIAEMLLVRGRLGGQLYATGANEDSARAAGINTQRLRAAAYIFSGLMAAVAGLIIAARIGSGDPQAGTTFTLASVTAVVVGGTSVFGGVGTAVGTFFGAMLIIVMQNVLNQFYVSAYWQYIWTGVLTLAAVGFHSLRTKERREAMRVAAEQLIRFNRSPIARKSNAAQDTEGADDG
jgi:ribose transport system ATP-binding protein